MSKRNIYLLQLEQGNFFVVAREQNEDPLLFFLTITIQYGFLKKYAPLRVLEQLTENSLSEPIDLDYHVKKQMILRGIEKVRGGSYLTEKLSAEQTYLLQRELGIVMNDTDETCPECVIKEIMTQYQHIPIERIPAIKTRIETDYAKYLEECRGLNQYKMDYKESRKQIDWVLAKCREQVGVQKNALIYHLLHSKEIGIYRQILVQLHRIYNTFMTMYGKPYENTLYSDLSLSHPEFVLDDFIYHGHRTHLPISLDRMERLLNAYYFFLIYIENRMTEMEFDVASWGVTAKWRFPRELYFLSMLTKKEYQKL